MTQKFIYCIGVDFAAANKMLTLMFREDTTTQYTFVSELPTNKNTDIIVVCNDFSQPLKLPPALHTFDILTTDLMTLMGSPKCAGIREKYSLNIRLFLNKTALIRASSKQTANVNSTEHEDLTEEEMEELNAL
jgi:hypothetical protein